MEDPVNVPSVVKFPLMRWSIMRALAKLADRAHQERAWVNQEFVERAVYEDFDSVVHALYDDSPVFEDTQGCIGACIFEGEVPALLALDAVLSPLVDELEGSDEFFMSQPQWPEVVARAGVALATMVRFGGFTFVEPDTKSS